ncbi:MAG TPA: site-2 protease family protein [Candidatus Saccharimonadales bacterium]
MSDKKSKTGLWALCAKFGGKALSLFAKVAKIGKVGFAVVTFIGYAAVFNWKFALLLMAAIGFHESGHVWAMKRMGIKTKGFYFLPFIGGAAIAEEQYRTYGENSYIAIMGPIWGALMAGAAGALYFLTGQPLWAAAGAWMATLNLFNLLPITPLDGGQLMRSIAFSIHKGVGVAFLALSLLGAIFIMWKLQIGLFVLILIVGAIELFVELRYRIKMYKVKQGTLNRYELPSSMLDRTQLDGVKRYPDAMNGWQLAMTAGSYIGTIAILLGILFLLKGVPGADLAANFLK